jgi:hypothetical protein
MHNYEYLKLPKFSARIPATRRSNVMVIRFAGGLGGSMAEDAFLLHHRLNGLDLPRSIF